MKTRTYIEKEKTRIIIYFTLHLIRANNQMLTLKFRQFRSKLILSTKELEILYVFPEFVSF